MNIADYRKKKLIQFLSDFEEKAVKPFYDRIDSIAKYGLGLHPDDFRSGKTDPFLMGIRKIVRVESSDKHPKGKFSFLGR